MNPRSGGLWVPRQAGAAARTAGALALLLVVLAVASVARAAAGPRLTLSVPESAFSVGDHVELRLQAGGPSSLLWGKPEVDVSGAAAASWAVVEPPRPVADADPPSWTAVLAPLRTGTLELPPVRVTVRRPDGGTETIPASGGAPVKVVSVLPPGEKVKPAPLADPVGVTGFPWEWVMPVAVAVLLVTLLAWALWRWRRRRRGGGAMEPARPPLDELRSLVAELAGAVGSEDVETICDRLARGARSYLERSTGEPAGEMTSFEIQRLARRSGWPAAVQLGFRDVLELADRVRFARRSVAESQVRDVLRRLVAAAEALDAWLRPAGESEGVAA
ncbi:MAG: hypothetical protein GXP47_12945 [Acidobacteria bacterium]|nr:hypothetical protein [Acidobacteriota bacterium]